MPPTEGNVFFSLFNGVFVCSMGSSDIYDWGKNYLCLDFFDKVWWRLPNHYSTRCFFACSVSVLNLIHMWLSLNSSSVIKSKLDLRLFQSQINEIVVSHPNGPNPWFFSSSTAKTPCPQEMVGRIPPRVYSSAASAKPSPWTLRSCTGRSLDFGTRTSPGWPTARRWAWMSWWTKAMIWMMGLVW